jgi:hypothetical protein
VAPLPPALRSQRARIAAAARDRRGLANTAPARAAAQQRFAKLVLAEAAAAGETLTEAELVKRAAAARREFYARLAYAGVRARTARGGRGE